MGAVDVWDLYLRVSRVGDRAGSISYGSVEDQRKRCEAKLAEVGGMVGQVVTQEDVSGGKPARERLAPLIDRIERGESAGIIVYDFSRFSREAEYDAMATLGQIHNAGGRLIGAVDGFDSGADHGAIMAAALATMARGYRKTVTERWSDARDRAFERGVYLTAVIPTGYDRAEDGSLVPNDQAHLVPQLFALRIEGWSYRKLALWLREHGVEGATDGRVRSMLKNRCYLGESSHDDRVIENAHPALVDEDSFNLVASMFGKRTGNKPVDVLAKGLAKCGSCGKTMILVKTPNGKRAFYCRGNSSGGCDNRAYIDAWTLDSYLLDYVWCMARKSDGPMADAVEAADRLDEAQALVTQKQIGLDQILEDTTIEVADRLTMAKAQREALELAKQNLAQAKADASTLGDLLTLFATDRPSTDRSERKRLLTTVLDEVRVRAVGREQVDVSKRTQIVWKGGVTYARSPESSVQTALSPPIDRLGAGQDPQIAARVRSGGSKHSTKS